MEKEKRATITVRGRVQGVFFRSNAEKEARKLGLKGYVKNTDDGSVEIVAEGSGQKIKSMIEWCRKGPAFSKVDDIDSAIGDATGEFETFSIRY